MDRVLLKPIFGHVKGKSCLSNLLAIDNKIAGFLDERKEVDVIYNDFQAFNTFSLSIFPSVFGYDGFDDEKVVE